MKQFGTSMDGTLTFLRNCGQICRIPVNVWDVKPQTDKWAVAKEGIVKTRKFFASMGLPQTLRQVGIEEESLEVMAKIMEGVFTDTYVPLTGEEVLEIYKAAS